MKVSIRTGRENDLQLNRISNIHAICSEGIALRGIVRFTGIVRRARLCNWERDKDAPGNPAEMYIGPAAGNSR